MEYFDYEKVANIFEFPKMARGPHKVGQRYLPRKQSRYEYGPVSVMPKFPQYFMDPRIILV